MVLTLTMAAYLKEVCGSVHGPLAAVPTLNLSACLKSFGGENRSKMVTFRPFGSARRPSERLVQVCRRPRAQS